MDGSRSGRDGKRPQGQACGCARAVRAATQGASGSLRRSHAGVARPKKIAVPVGQGRVVIEAIRQGLKEDGFEVSVSQLCRWLELPRRTFYYRSIKAAPRLREDLVEPVKALIEQEPVVRVPDRGRPAKHEQEHGAAHLPVEGLASTKACHWSPPAN